MATSSTPQVRQESHLVEGQAEQFVGLQFDCSPRAHIVGIAVENLPGHAVRQMGQQNDMAQAQLLLDGIHLPSTESAQLNMLLVIEVTGPEQLCYMGPQGNMMLEIGSASPSRQ